MATKLTAAVADVQASSPNVLDFVATWFFGALSGLAFALVAFGPVVLIIAARNRRRRGIRVVDADTFAALVADAIVRRSSSTGRPVDR